MSGEVAFVELGVEDADRARAFYGALFGWGFEPGPSGGYLMRTPNVPGGVHGGDPGASPYVFFRVDDLDVATSRVRDLGGSVEGRPDGDAEAAGGDTAMETAYGRFVLCRDDQGSPFGMFEAPRTGAGATA